MDGDRYADLVTLSTQLRNLRLQLRRERREKNYYKNKYEVSRKRMQTDFDEIETDVGRAERTVRADITSIPSYVWIIPAIILLIIFGVWIVWSIDQLNKKIANLIRSVVQYGPISYGGPYPYSYPS
jgi:hypothetical protein